VGCFSIRGDAVLSDDGRTLLLATGPERLVSRLRVGLHTILGSYKYNLDKGLPWFALLDKPNQALLRRSLRDFFLSHSEVASIISLEFIGDRVARTLNVTYQLRMADGRVVIATSAITPLVTTGT